MYIGETVQVHAVKPLWITCTCTNYKIKGNIFEKKNIEKFQSCYNTDLESGDIQLYPHVNYQTACWFISLI